MILILIKASLIIIVLLGFYKIFLERESFFAANRIYLLTCLLCACTLPFMVLPKLLEHQGVVSTWIEPLEEKEAVAQEEAIGPNLEERIAKFPATSPKESNSSSTFNTKQEEAASADRTLPTAILAVKEQQSKRGLTYCLALLYLFGVIVLLVKFLAQIGFTLWKVYKQEDKIEDEDGVLVHMRGDIEPCSFFKYIFINPSSYDYETYEQIIAHEKIHIKQRHTIDLLLSELAVIVLWFNPFIWVLRTEVEKNIEYQTDNLMIKGEKAAKESYQLNLLKIATYTQPLAITTNYNQSLIKQRILKMNAKKSNPYSYWKYTFIGPLLFMLLLFLNKPNLGNAQNPAFPISFEINSAAAPTPNDLIATPSVDIPKENPITDQNISGNTEAAMPPTINVAKKETPSIKGLTDLTNGCKKLTQAIHEQNIAAIKALLKTVDPNCVEPQTSAGLKRDQYRKMVHTPLSAAAKLGHLEITALLLDAGSDIDFHDIDIQSPLMAASYEGHLDVVKLLVEKGADINVISESHGAALHCAAKGGYLEVMTYLLEQGANINAYCNREGVPLNIAARNRDTEMQVFLIEKGALVNPENDTQVSPLTRAATRGDKQTVEFLLSKGAKLGLEGDWRSALYVAAQRGHTETVRLLLSKGANINLQAGERGTALIAAARYGHTETVELLLSKGASIDMESGELGTALIAAAWEGHRETVDLLLVKGAHIDLQTKKECPALNIPVKPEFITGVDMLLGASSDLQSGVGVTALIAAARNRKTETVKLLLSKGANIHLQNNEQGTALIAAARNGSYKAAELLLSKGAKVNTQNDRLGSALTIAARNGQNRTIELLLSKNADINAQNDRHGSALNAAARNGHLATVKLLVLKGADIHLESKGEGTALMAAYRNAHQHIVKYLISKGAKGFNED